VSASDAAGAGAAAVAGTSAAAVAADRAPSSTGAAESVAPKTAPAGQSPTPASERSSVENFGLPPPEQRSPEREYVEIVATVTELRQTVPNAYVITLDNGQVWRQPHPMPYPLRTGLVVRVRETKFGYRLSAPELHGQINVERVR
jgi:hypothetical protein